MRIGAPKGGLVQASREDDLPARAKAQRTKLDGNSDKYNWIALMETKSVERRDATSVNVSRETKEPAHAFPAITDIWTSYNMHNLILM